MQNELSDDDSNEVGYAYHSSDDSLNLEEDRKNKEVSKVDYIEANVHEKS